MAPFDVLVIQHWQVELPQPGRHLPGVPRMHAVVASGGRDQDRWIRAAAVDEVIRRETANERPLLRDVGIAVFPHPARAGQQHVESPHVEQRHLADHRPEEFRPPHVHVADEQPAVAAPLDAEPPRRSDLPPDEILGHGREVFVGPRPAGLERRLVPRRPELAAAPDVGDHIHMPAFQPGRPRERFVGGHERNLEAAVAVEQRRRGAVERQVGRADLKVGHPRAVGRHRLVLAHPQAPSFEERRGLLEPLRLGGRRGGGAAGERRRLDGIGRDQEKVVRLILIDGRHTCRADLRHAGHRLEVPRTVAKAGRRHTAADAVERGEQDPVSRARKGHE